MKKVCIIVSRGSLDGIYPALIMANGARMEGIEASLFFTFFGLNGLVKKTMDAMKVSTVGNSALNMAMPMLRLPMTIPFPTWMGAIPGVSAFATGLMKKEMEKLDIPPVREFLEMISDSGGKIFGCKLAMDMFKQFAPGAGASLSDAGFAAVDLSQFWGTLMVPFALLAYAAVFLVSHTIHILILISPFTTVDAALKTFRIFLLSTVAGTSFASPTVGAVWSGLIVLCCLPLAGWAFRLMVFGQIHAWDILTFRRRRFVPDTAANAAFLARKVGGVPRRTYGFVRRDASGGLVFSWRPWLLLPERTTPLPSGPLAVGRGLFHPEVLEIDGESTRDLLDLPPRFKGHEETFARIHAIGEVRDVGLRAAWSWLKGLFSSAPAHAS